MANLMFKRGKQQGCLCLSSEGFLVTHHPDSLIAVQGQWMPIGAKMERSGRGTRDNGLTRTNLFLSESELPFFFFS